MCRVFAFLVCCALMALMLACNSGFTDEDVANVQGQIKTEFEKKGFTVKEVKLIRESDRKLVGFAKLSKKLPLVGETEISKDCTAIMQANSKDYMWECK